MEGGSENWIEYRRTHYREVESTRNCPTMPYKRYVSTVHVGGHSFVGEERAKPKKARLSAARAVLKNFGKPYKSHVSNVQVEASFEELCKSKMWALPKYTTVRCSDPEKVSHVSGPHNLHAHQIYSGYENSIGRVETYRQPFLGSGRFKQPWESAYPYFISTANIVSKQSATAVDARCENYIGTLNDISERFQSQEPKLRVVVGYDDGCQKGNQWVVVCSVSVGFASKQCSGKGRSMQVAKEQAASLAYEWLSGQLQGPVPAHTNLSCADVTSKQGAMKVGANCMDALRQVCQNLMEPLQDGVFAAILMTQDGNKAEIVSIGSGTGFIYQQNLVANGKAIFDCHAEVLARRGLEAYLFNQIQNASKGVPQSIVRKVDGKYYLEEGVHFHLFVSKVPCGDACIPLKAKDAGCLRYRKDDGEGDLLKPEEDPRHYKMCCSAKIALWNVVGIQGALLAQLLDRPVYLSTIIVKGAEDDHKESLQRAFFGRLEGVRGLPDKYHVNEPTVVVMPSDDGAQGKGGDSKHLAFTWTAGTQKEEMIETPTGLRKSGDLDVSKRGFANYWASLCPRDVGKGFHVIKQGAKDYQNAKKKFESCFPESEWIHKSPKFDSFQV